ncbi:hypothetical protein [Hydrogenophaga sp.]|uniref:hypothetical protein n=1 Tax=Hydrogenophaga sp. TaxID=1904254 RepID=UPI002614AC7E|nr:hypothetical protein [Hydrogenophaga sp.]MDM7950872.1 hypothetical protein [Hydrogenophaga sp.]
MSKALSEFAPIRQYPGLWSAEKGALRCTALRLRDNSLCLYSPVLGLGDDARNSLAALGDVSFLLAPNHYHNKGLVEYAEAFPEAELICSERARPRLENQTSLVFGGLTNLVSLLVDDCQLIEPAGLKTGEVWFTVKTLKDVVWVVCDAFKGSSGKLGEVTKQIEMLGTFPTFGIQDKDTYAAWVESQLRVGSPTLVMPCHGTMGQGGDMASDIRSLLR